MGGSSAKLAGETARMNQELAQKEFGFSKTALDAGLKYAGAQYRGGGMRQDRKFQALLTDAGEAQATPVGGVGNLAGLSQRESDMAAGRALGFSSVGQQKALSAVDEINRLRTVLSSQGLKTTNLGSEASGDSIRALSLMAPHPTLSTALGAAAAGASIYGGVQQGLANRPQSTTIAPIADVSGTYGSAAGIASPTQSFFDTQNSSYATG